MSLCNIFGKQMNFLNSYVIILQKKKKKKNTIKWMRIATNNCYFVSTDYILHARYLCKYIVNTIYYAQEFVRGILRTMVCIVCIDHDY